MKNLAEIKARAQNAVDNEHLIIGGCASERTILVLCEAIKELTHQRKWWVERNGIRLTDSEIMETIADNHHMVAAILVKIGEKIGNN